MKRCPTCQRVFQDERMRFCRHDGAALLLAGDEFAEQSTMLLSGARLPVSDPLTPSGSLAATMPLKRRRVSKSKVIDSLAVLPFADESGDPQTEYLAQGIAETIINALSSLPKLRVVPRATVARFKGGGIDPHAAGQALGVRAVLTGRVLQVGDMLVVKTELIDVPGDAQVWGEQYRRPLADVFELEAEMAREISHKLKLRLNPDEQKRLAKRHTDNTEAYRFYLKGRYYADKRTTDWIKKGIDEFQRAIDLDPNYALAYAGLADAYALLGSSTGECPPVEWYPKAQSAALKALILDDTLAEAHTSLGFYYMMYEWNFPQARESFGRAIALNPNYCNAHDGYSFYYKATGQHQKAITACLRAQEADPLSLFATVSLGWAYYFARDYDEAIAQQRKALEMDGQFAFAFWNLGLAAAAKGDLEESVAALQQAYEISAGLTYAAHLAYVYGLARREDDAQRILALLHHTAQQKYVSAYYFALAYLGLGQQDETFAWLDRAVKEHASFLAFLNVEPIFDGLRADPRFAELQWRIGL